MASMVSMFSLYSTKVVYICALGHVVVSRRVVLDAEEETNSSNILYLFYHPSRYLNTVHIVNLPASTIGRMELTLLKQILLSEGHEPLKHDEPCLKCELKSLLSLTIFTCQTLSTVRDER